MSAGARAAFAACLTAVLAVATTTGAATVDYELVVAERDLNVTGRPVRAVTINGGVPGPTLRFAEGDLARIRVRNELSEATSIHWHGVLVPPGMDGVPWVSAPPIPAGGVHTYEFPVRQSGTYWYHSHSGLQEQRGMYGAIVIAAPDGAGADRDEAVVLSDWTDDDPERVLRTLKRGAEWYALAKGSAPSLVGAIRAGRVGAFFANELQRMPPMDIADVAYDRFLANGRPETAVAAQGLDVVRLRIVNGSATTYFHLEFAGGPVTIVAADGQPVEPVSERRLLIAVAETYDLVVMVPPEGSWELRATAHDGSGHASVWVGDGERHAAPQVPRPDLYRPMGGVGLAEVFALTPQGAVGMPDRKVRAGAFDDPRGAHAHGGRGEGGGAAHAGHEAAGGAPGPGVAPEGGAERPLPPYPRLRATRPTALAAARPVREVRLTLDGDMERYVWLIDGRALWEQDTIAVRAGETVRFILVNRTMMHHPMRLHGHFFRVLNGQGERAPLKHTVDVAPMGTTVIEFAADELGDWFFHCHLLYHMESGMARVVRYDGFDAGPWPGPARRAPHGDSWRGFAAAELLTSMTRGELRLSRTRDDVLFGWEAGWGGGGRERTAVAGYRRVVNAFFSAFGGLEAAGGDAEGPGVRGVAGARYLLPLTIGAAVAVDSAGGVRAGLEKSLPVLPRLDAHGEAAYDTREGWHGGAGLAWTLGRSVSAVGRWDSRFGWGAGVRLSF